MDGWMDLTNQKAHHTNILGVSFNFFICTTVQVDITGFCCRSTKIIPTKIKIEINKLINNIYSKAPKSVTTFN